MTVFHKPPDYQAFEKVLSETHARLPCRILAYCLMPTHWHLLLWPRADGELSEFMRLLTVTHTQRWHANRRTAGTGPVYQGRFKSFPVQSDEHFLTVARYIERNPVRAQLVERAEDWQWSSLWRRRNATREQRMLLTRWPVEIPRNWRWRVQQPETDAELEAMRCCVHRGRPFGTNRWQTLTANRLTLAHSLRPLGRPAKQTKP